MVAICSASLVHDTLTNAHCIALYYILRITVGVAQIVNRGDVGQYGAVFKIVFETTNEHMNKRTCFAINGSSDGKVTPQGIFPDMSKFIVRHSTIVYTYMCICDHQTCRNQLCKLKLH